MWDDPIVREVREAGDKLAREAGYDLHEFCQRIVQHQSRYADRLVTLPSRKLHVAASQIGDTDRVTGP
jgi:hypothetical protein